MDGVWAYIAHRDGYWAAIAAADLSDIGRWIGRYQRAGFTISPTKNRETYLVALTELKPWHESPEWLAKKSRKSKPKQAELI